MVTNLPGPTTSKKEELVMKVSLCMQPTRSFSLLRLFEVSYVENLPRVYHRHPKVEKNIAQMLLHLGIGL